MSLNFPHKPEVRLGKAPLDEVICQVKFSPILRISKEPPSDFQEEIRDRFPGLRVEQGVILQLPGVVGSEKPSVEASPRIYRFLTTDESSNVALAADFFALSTKHYIRWDDFVRDLDIAYKAIQKIYHPGYSTRIGLRFINRFARKNTSCKTYEQLLDLFRSELTCLIRTGAWKEPSEMLSQIILVDNKAKLALRTGYGKDKTEPFFVLDLDYFEEGQLPLDSLLRRVNRYHTRIYEAFRWCLLDDSLTRFEPLSQGA